MEEFLELHPEHADDDEAALMTARIGHEKQEREALERQKNELLKKKLKLIAENKKRKEDLANLDKDLENFIDVRFCLDLLCSFRLYWLIEAVADFLFFFHNLLGRQTDPEPFRQGCLRKELGSVLE